jgi:hypothetical protein
MSKSTGFIIAALAVCLGLIIGVLITSSDVENFKKEKEQAEIALHRSESTKERALETQEHLRNKLDQYEQNRDRLIREKSGSKESSKSEEVPESSIVGTRIPGGFSYSNVGFWPAEFLSPFKAKVLGEVTNNSGKNYGLALFQVSLYDEENQLIEVCIVRIEPFLLGETKSFVGDLSSDRSLIKRYRIAFDGGLLQDE